MHEQFDEHRQGHGEVGPNHPGEEGEPGLDTGEPVFVARPLLGCFVRFLGRRAALSRAPSCSHHSPSFARSSARSRCSSSRSLPCISDIYCPSLPVEAVLDPAQNVDDDVVLLLPVAFSSRISSRKPTTSSPSRSRGIFAFAIVTQGKPGAHVGCPQNGDCDRGCQGVDNRLWCLRFEDVEGAGTDKERGPDDKASRAGLGGLGEPVTGCR